MEEDIDDVERDQIGFLTEITKRRKQASNKSTCDKSTRPKDRETFDEPLAYNQLSSTLHVLYNRSTP